MVNQSSRWEGMVVVQRLTHGLLQKSVKLVFKCAANEVRWQKILWKIMMTLNKGWKIMMTRTTELVHQLHIWKTNVWYYYSWMLEDQWRSEVMVKLYQWFMFLLSCWWTSLDMCCRDFRKQALGCLQISRYRLKTTASTPVLHWSLVIICDS